MAGATLLCTVRGCGEPLRRSGGSWSCARGHSFDVAKRGYVNLLQPQDRRSLDAGDSAAVVAARRRLAAAGYDRELIVALAEELRRAARRQIAAARRRLRRRLAARRSRRSCWRRGRSRAGASTFLAPAIDAAARQARSWLG